MKRVLTAALVCAGSLSLFGQDVLLNWMDGVAQQELDQRDAAIAAIHTRAEAEHRQQLVRKKLLTILGGLPDFRGPLNARVTGRMHNDAYTLEKVIYESLPHYFVTADLYLPNTSGRHPAVLLSAGHTTLGKTENHRIGANLAAKGFVALAYDPVGLGERRQTYDARIGRSLAGCCTNEHLQAGAQSMLIGESVARYFIWDAMRSVDYLISRPEVDQDRIGAAGCSGGGCLTTYVAALDPRIKAAAPACFLNSFRLLFRGPDPDSEMSLPGFLAAGLDHADFLELAAPAMPWMVLTTEGDFFTPPGVRMVYEEARRWYTLYGAENKIGFFMGPGAHGTPRESREQIYSWMIRWLKNGAGDAREQTVPLYPDFDLQVTKTGEVDEEPGSRKLYQVILDEYRAKKQPLGLSELGAELRRLGVPTDKTSPSVEIQEQSVDNGSRRVSLRIESEPGVWIGATLYAPSKAERKPALLLVKDKSTEALARAAVSRGDVVLELEPRDSPSQDDHRPFLGNWITNLRADSIGRNLAAMRAHDILRGVDFLSRRDEVDSASIRATALGVKGIWLLLAAAADSRISRVWLDHTPYSLSSALERPLNADLLDAMIPGFLLHWDLDGLVAAVRPRSVYWTDPSDWMGHPVRRSGDYQYRYDEQPDEELLAKFLGE